MSTGKTVDCAAALGAVISYRYRIFVQLPSGRYLLQAQDICSAALGAVISYRYRIFVQLSSGPFSLTGKG